MKLSQFKVLAFDCYGTLIDWETGITRALKPLTDRVGRDLTRDEILEAHARQESSHQRLTPAKKYGDLLACVYKRLSEEWGVKVSMEEAARYGRSVEHWPAFEDSAEALGYLAQHFKLVILSNVDNASFTFSNRKLGVEFDAVYTAEDVGSYKPATGNFEYMLERLAETGHGRDEILHTAESMFHDHVPAKALGLHSCWIHRRHGKEGFGATMPPGDMPRCDFRFESMAEMVKAHMAEGG